MNNYIVLDGKRYKTNADNWVETEFSPRQVKRLLSSAGDVTFGIDSYRVWVGDIFADVVPDTNFGSLSDLETTFRKKTALTMQDHYGVSRSVALGGAMRKVSIAAMWDAATNEFHIPVEITTL